MFGEQIKPLFINSSKGMSVYKPFKFDAVEINGCAASIDQEYLLKSIPSEKVDSLKNIMNLHSPQGLAFLAKEMAYLLQVNDAGGIDISFGQANQYNQNSEKGTHERKAGDDSVFLSSGEKGILFVKDEKIDKLPKGQNGGGFYRILSTVKPNGTIYKARVDWMDSNLNPDNTLHVGYFDGKYDKSFKKIYLYPVNLFFKDAEKEPTTNEGLLIDLS